MATARPYPVIEARNSGEPGSLRRMCIQKAYSTINTIWSVGGMDYEVVQPILSRIDNAAQLQAIEFESPQIKKDTGELWKRLISRDIPKYKDQIVEPENDDWAGLYQSFKALDDEDKEAAKEQLRQRLQGINNERNNNLSQRVEARRMPKPPRDPKMIANAGKLLSGRRSRGPPEPPKPKNAVEKARQQAQQQARMLATAKQHIPVNLAQIRKAPAGMVVDHEREALAKKHALPPPPSLKKPDEPMSILDKKAAEIRARQAGDITARDMHLDARIQEQLEIDRERRSQPAHPQSVSTSHRVAPAPQPPKKILPPRPAYDCFMPNKKPVRAPAVAPRPISGTIGTNASIPKPAPIGRGRPGVGPGSKNAVERRFIKPVGAVAERRGTERLHSDRQGIQIRPSQPAPIARAEPRAPAPAVPQPRSNIMSHISSIVNKEDSRQASSSSPSTSLKRSADGYDASIPNKRVTTPSSRNRTGGGNPPQFTPPTYQTNDRKRRSDDDDLFGSSPISSPNATAPGPGPRTQANIRREEPGPRPIKRSKPTV